MKKQLGDNYELKIKNVVTDQIKNLYEGVDDPLKIAPFSKEIKQKAESDEEISSEINHSKWLRDL